MHSALVKLVVHRSYVGPVLEGRPPARRLGGSLNRSSSERPTGAACKRRSMEPAQARAIWQRLETLNAVSYFAAECRDAPDRLGLKGFWMGYFACRAAPMGPVEPGVVEATFFNFHPGRVRRAIPDAWTIVDPKELVVARADAAASALRRLLGDGDAEQLAQRTLPVLWDAIDSARGAGRPLFAANRDVALAADDPVAALWQAATTLREHRGDAHVALLTGEGLDGCEVHVLFAACEGLPSELYQQSRGWSAEDWTSAAERLTARGVLAPGAEPSDRGRALRDQIERRTDELAVEPYAAVGADRIGQLLAEITPTAERIAGAGEITFPNPMGLPRPDHRAHQALHERG